MLKGWQDSLHIVNVGIVELDSEDSGEGVSEGHFGYLCNLERFMTGKNKETQAIERPALLSDSR